MPAFTKPMTLVRALSIKPGRKILTPILKQQLTSSSHPQTPSNESTDSLDHKASPEYTHTTSPLFTDHPPKSFKSTDFETPITTAVALDAEGTLLETLKSDHDVETKDMELKKELGERNMVQYEHLGHFHHGFSEAGFPTLPWYW